MSELRKGLTALWTRESLRVSLILLLLLNILFFPCIWGKKSLLDSAELCPSVMPRGAWEGTRAPIRWSRTGDAAAAAWFFEPLLAFTGYEYKKGAVPLWNPYQGYGAPFAANMQSQPFYPLTILLSLDVTPRTYSLYLLARLFIVGLFGYLFLRLFVSFISATAGGIATMLAGYYVLYINMPHLSVEILIPAALYTAELVLRSPTYRRILGFIAVLTLTVLGGMPESSLLLFVFLYAYIAMRILTDAELRAGWLRLTSRIAAASVAGLALSSFMVLPFWELMRRGFDTHQPGNLGGLIPGLWHLSVDPQIFTYVFPLLYGPYRLYNSAFGIIGFFLMLIAVFTAFQRQKKGAIEPDGRLRAITLFCFACAVLLILKRYGVEPINDLGRLPPFRYVVFYKYGEAVPAVCMAILSAIGLERLIRAQVSGAILATALLLSFALLPIAPVVGQKVLDVQMKALHFQAWMPQVALGVAGGALVAVCICIAWYGMRDPRIGLCILVILTAELSTNYIPELYYPGNLPNQSQNPYAGAPYIKFLKHQCLHFERVFARQDVLTPDWGSVFQLQDIRDLDAMYYRNYLPFVRNFVAAETMQSTRDLVDRFSASGAAYPFKLPLERRLLQLSSVKYLVSMTAYADVPFQQVYNSEVKVYEYDDVLPRAGIYFHADVVRDEADELKKLADPNLDIFQTAIIGGKLTQAQSAAIAQMNQGEARQVMPAQITSYGSEAVEVHASLDRRGILVLNDTGYPGWNVTVDGSPANWMKVNYLFRGVLLSQGKHVVRFVYRPRSFYLGGAISIGALLCLLPPLCWRLRFRLTRWNQNASKSSYMPTA